MSDESVDSWGSEDFARRAYLIQGSDLDEAKSIRVKVEIDGKQHADMQIREPGLLAVVSRPDQQGIMLEVVQPGGVRYVDHRLPNGEPVTPPPTDWQIQAILE